MIITTEEVKTHLGIDSDDYDSAIASIIETAQELFECDLGYNIEKKLITETFRGGNNDTYFCKNLKIAFDNYGVETFLQNINGTVVESEFSYDGETGEVYYFFACGASYTITYYGGWGVVPADIKRAVLLLASDMLVKQEGSDLSATASTGDQVIKSKKIGDMTITYQDNSSSGSTASSSNDAYISSILSKYKIF